MKKIIGHYKNWLLVEQDEVFYVISREKKKILLKGTEEYATRGFTMLIAGFITEEELD